MQISYIYQAEIQKQVSVHLNEILVITKVIIKRNQCAFEPLPCNDDSSTAWIQIIIVVISVILRLQDTECDVNSYKYCKNILILSISMSYMGLMISNTSLHVPVFKIVLFYSI